jgi:Protein of unknown function (DUF3489)
VGRRGAKLVGAGWAKEIRAPNGAPVWRKDRANGSAFTLKLTAKGQKAVVGPGERPAGTAKGSASVASEKPEPKALSRQKKRVLSERAATSNEDTRIETAATIARAPSASSKLGRILAMLSAEAGATIGELIAATGWLEHSTRAALTGLRRRGYALSLRRSERDGASVYRIAAPGGKAAK